MADKGNRDDDSMSGRSDEELRGVAGNLEDEDALVEADDLDEEEDEESTTF